MQSPIFVILTERQSITESHLCEIMCRNWSDSRRPSAILHLIRRFYTLNMPVLFTATSPIFPTWFKRQKPSPDISMQRIDSSDDDEESDAAQSQEVR